MAPVHANQGVEVWYRQQLTEAVRDCAASMFVEIRKTWTEDMPKGGMAQDAKRKPPATKALQNTLDKWSSKWQDKFNTLSTGLARKFAARASKVTDTQVAASLKQAGFTVAFKPTPASVEAYHAVIGENVNLIRNLGRETLDDIQGKVWASVRAGHDMGTLSLELAKIPGINGRRAALIARDQNNKAKAVIEATRRKELGIKEAIWMHSGGGVTPRKSHVEAGAKKVRYNIATGWYDPDAKEYTWPGVQINCRCVSKAIIPGLDDSFY